MKDLFYTLLTMLNEMSPYVLLGFLIAGVLHSFVAPTVMTRHLSGRGWKPVIKAALFGIPLPLCSCGVLPTAVALRRSGASKSATTSFLIATPQTGVDSIAATYSLLGLPFAILRPIAALAGAMLGGIAVDYFDRNDREQTDCDGTCSAEIDERPKGFWRRAAASIHYGLIEMVSHVGKWLTLGLIIAALITIFVPDEFFISLNRYPIAAMLAMVIIAVPMYVCATGSIPIALSLMLKGLSPGVAFVLLMAGPAANFASVLILNRTQGRRATFIYVASVVITALAFGLMIHYLLPPDWFIPSLTDATLGAECCNHSFGWFESACSALLVCLLIYTSIRKHFHNHKTMTANSTIQTIKVQGMSCPHCQARVEKAIAAVNGVTNVKVNLTDGSATVAGTANRADIISAITSAGYDCI